MMDHTRKIETPLEIAESANGSEPHIILRTRIKNKHLRIFNDLAQKLGHLNLLIQKVQAAQEGDAEEILQQAEQLQSEVQDLTNKAYDTYVYLVVDWNWQDFETGEPLPKPDDPIIFRDELTPQQTAWLRAQINNLRQYRATEGNLSSSTL